MSSFSDVDISRHHGKDFVVHPFDAENGVTPVGYDLGVGLAVLLRREDPNEPIEYLSEFIPDKSTLLIPPNCSVFIVTGENIWLSPRVLATLHARGSYAAKGLFVNSTTVDPNWKGRLTILVRNISDSSITITAGEKFLTMVFHGVQTPTKAQPEGNPSRVAQRYRTIYGDEFSSLYLNHNQNTDLANINREFDSLVESASKPTLATHIREVFQVQFDKVATMIGTRGASAIGVVSITLTIIALLTSLSLQWLWPSIQSNFGVAQAYDSQVVLSQITIFLACLAILTSYFKRS